MARCTTTSFTHQLSKLVTFFFALLPLLLLFHPHHDDGKPSSSIFFAHAYNSSDFLVNYPAPHTQNNRILGLVLNYGFGHMEPLWLIFAEYVSMCEGGWDPTVVLFSVGNWTTERRRMVRYKTFCYRLNTSLPIRYELYNSSIGIRLGAEHRPYARQELNSFDLFVYHEDDIVLTFSHVQNYLYETKRLNGEGYHGMEENVIGFLRYRRLFRGGNHHDPGWVNYGEQDWIEQDLLEEVPNFYLKCFGNQPYYEVSGNTHQALWILTRSQLEYLQERCNFLYMLSPSREHMSSLFLFDKPCVMRKLIPAGRMHTFSILHYYQQRHVSWATVFDTEENLMMDEYQNQGQKRKLPTPDCWKDIVDKSRETIRRPETNYSSSIITMSG